MSIGEKIKKRRLELNLTQKELADAVGITEATLSRYENNLRIPNADILKKIATILKTDMDYFVDIPQSQPTSQAWHIDEVVKKFLENNPDVRPVGKLVPVPIIGTVRAGSDGSLACEEYLGSELVELDTVKDGDYFFLRVKGDSMYPEIFEGDLVLVRKQPDVESGELAVVIVNGDEGVVKKVIKKENAIVLQSLNPKYEPIVITEGQDFMIVGKVKRVVRIY